MFNLFRKALSLERIDFKSIIDSSDEGIAVFDKNGRKLYENKIFKSLGLSDINTVIQADVSSKRGDIYTAVKNAYPSGVRVINHGNYFSVHASFSSKVSLTRERVLRSLLDFHRLNPDIFIATAQALGENLPWHWVGVTRFLDGNGTNAHFHGWWDKDQIKTGFDKNLLGSACEVVAKKGSFVFYTDQAAIHTDFPEWKDSRNMGICCYAGMPYLVNGKAFGHVMLLHGLPASPDMDRGMTEDILHMVTQYIGSNLQLESVREQALASSLQAKIDVSTGLGNALAGEGMFARLTNCYHARIIRDAGMAVLWLSNFKELSSSASDDYNRQVLLDLTRQLHHTWRANDHLIRWQDDMFIIAVENFSPEGKAEITSRVNLLMNSLHQQYPELILFAGFSFLSENEGSAQATFKDAQKNLYRASESARAGSNVINLHR